ncbi:MAG: hypothetical protein WCF90_10440 [Methanomicrobiales archaeon]
MPDENIVLMGGNDVALKNNVWRSTDKSATWTRITANAEWTSRHHQSYVVTQDGSIVLMGIMMGIF